MKRFTKVLVGLTAFLIGANLYVGYKLFQKNYNPSQKIKYESVLGNELYKEATAVQAKYRDLKKEKKKAGFIQQANNQNLEEKVDIKEELCRAYDFEKCDFREINLNDDGINELVLTNPMLCGSGGCTTYVFDSKGHELAYLEHGLNKLGNKTNGYKDIIEINRTYNDEVCGSETWEYNENIFKWNGFKYNLKQTRNYCESYK